MTDITKKHLIDVLKAALAAAAVAFVGALIRGLNLDSTIDPMAAAAAIAGFFALKFRV